MFFVILFSRIIKIEDEMPAGYKEILAKFVEAGKHLKRITKYKVWQDGIQAKMVYSNKFLK